MISSENVIEIFMNCLFKDNEVMGGKPIIEPVVVEGITNKFYFHPDRLKESADKIDVFIKELPEQFKDGWTFLNLCQTKSGEQWTGLHQVCEQLMLLAVAIKRMGYCLPRELWRVLPGGMPYVQII